MDKLEEKKATVDLVKSIKSSYIIEGVFCFLNEKQKMKIFLYNKHLQKMCNIDLSII